MKQYVIVAKERHEIKYEQNAIRESDEPAIVAINQKKICSQGFASYSPMNIAMLVHCFDGKDNLSHVEPRNRDGENLVFDEHGH